jgi:hypothetical protein
MLSPNLKCGIYKIVNVVNGKVYIGSTKGRFASRFDSHKRDLSRNVHCNRHLQGKKRSAEYKAKLSEAQKKRWAAVRAANKGVKGGDLLDEG